MGPSLRLHNEAPGKTIVKMEANEEMQEFCQRKNVPWLKSYLHDRGIQTSSDGKNKRKAELVELSFNASKMKLPKITDGDHEEEKVLISKLRHTKDGILPNPDTIKNWTNNFSNVPELTFPDICNYLVGKAEYDLENLKSFKSLQGYRLFKDGHVIDLKLHKIEGMEYTFIKFNVKPTERSKADSGKTYYDGIVVLKSDGSVHGAFCPCLGGADGSCRHVAACLFDVESTVHRNQQQSCTSKECVWKRQGKPNENACAISDLKVCKTEYGKRERKAVRPTNFDPRSLKHDPFEFLDNLREGLNEMESASVILQVLPKPQPVVVDENEITETISKRENVLQEEEVEAEDVYTVLEMRDSFLSSRGIEILSPNDITNDICKEFKQYIAINQNQALMIFDKTTSQGSTDFWMLQRQGRLTASNFYRICHMRETTKKDNILKDLLGYCPLPPEKQPYQFEWGHEKEKSAINMYLKKMKKHKHIFVAESGLVINPMWPFIGASPDGLRYCKCCGKVILEVKSLYAKRSLPPHIAAQEFIYNESGKFHLKKETRWYYQIQGEMAVTKLKHADLVIYTNKGIVIVQVPFDPEFWLSILTKLENFFDTFVVPELLTQQLKKNI